jgi:Mycobacterium 19 kDa lipoprotein antigen
MHYVLAAGAVALVTVAGCSAGAKFEPTVVVFDGESYTIDGPTSCLRQLGGTLAINAPVASKWGGGLPDGGRRLIRVVLTDGPRLVVKSAGVRIDDARGFSDISEEMWATKADNTYTINGRMAPEGRTTTTHQFKIEVTCANIDTEYVTLNPPAA